MDTRRNQDPRAMAAALAALLLPFSCGCTTTLLEDATTRYSTFYGVRGAYSHGRELGIVYTEGGPYRSGSNEGPPPIDPDWRRDRLAWFALERLERLRAPSPRAVLPVREERRPEALPSDAKPVPCLSREGCLPSVPEGATIAVFSWCPPGGLCGNQEHILDDHQRVFAWLSRPPGVEATVVMARKNGTVLEQDVLLPHARRRAWWFYPLLPLALAVDVPTYPFQFVYWRYCWDPHIRFSGP